MFSLFKLCFHSSLSNFQSIHSPYKIFRFIKICKVNKCSPITSTFSIFKHPIIHNRLESCSAQQRFKIMNRHSNWQPINKYLINLLLFIQTKLKFPTLSPLRPASSRLLLLLLIGSTCIIALLLLLLITTIIAVLKPYFSIRFLGIHPLFVLIKQRMWFRIIEFSLRDLILRLIVSLYDQIGRFSSSQK